jgi:hypothetical protein
LKTVHIIIGIFVCLLAIVGTATATVLNSNDGSNVELVSTTISTTHVAGDTVTFSVVPLSGQPAGWISKVGYNVPSLDVISITDNKNNGWEKKGNKPQPMFNGMKFNEYDIDHQDHEVTSVKIVFSGTITGTPTFAAHVQWGTGSAYFGPGGTTQIPEFPSMALPIAAIMGIMFIFGRRRKE